MPWYSKELENIKYLIAEAREKLEELRDEQEERLGNYPENLQSSSNYYRSEERYDIFDTAVSDLESVECNLEELE